MRRSVVAGGRMRANTPRHSRDPAHACLEERPFVRVARVLQLFGFESAFSRRSPRQGKSQAARNGAGSQPTLCNACWPARKRLDLARWSAKPGYESICNMAGGDWICG